MKYLQKVTALMSSYPVDQGRRKVDSNSVKQKILRMVAIQVNSIQDKSTMMVWFRMLYNEENCARCTSERERAWDCKQTGQPMQKIKDCPQKWIQDIEAEVKIIVNAANQDVFEVSKTTTFALWHLHTHVGKSFMKAVKLGPGKPSP